MNNITIKAFGENDYDIFVKACENRGVNPNQKIYNEFVESLEIEVEKSAQECARDIVDKMIIKSDEFLAALDIGREEKTPRPRTPRPVSEIGECNLCGFEKNVFFDLCPPDYHVEARMCRECFDRLREMGTNHQPAETTNWINEGF